MDIHMLKEMAGQFEMEERYHEKILFCIKY
jgi:hypothetical protein